MGRGSYASLDEYTERFHERKNSRASIVVSSASQAEDFGSLMLDGSGQITGFSEKVKDGVQSLVNAGIYCFGREIFSLMPCDKKFSLETDFFPTLTGKQFYGYHVAQEFVDIGTPQRYESLKRDFKKG